MDDYEKAVLDPTLVFTTPEEVLERDDLTREQKIKILKVWEYDAREIEVAEEENMMTDKPNILDTVLAALNQLHARQVSEHSPPTKHGTSDVEIEEE